METQVIISKKEYDYLIIIKNQLKDFKKKESIYIGALSSHKHGAIEYGNLHLLNETEIVKILLKRIDDMQEIIKDIAKQRDKYEAKVKLKWWQTI